MSNNQHTCMQLFMDSEFICKFRKRGWSIHIRKLGCFNQPNQINPKAYFDIISIVVVAAAAAAASFSLFLHYTSDTCVPGLTVNDSDCVLFTAKSLFRFCCALKCCCCCCCCCCCGGSSTAISYSPCSTTPSAAAVAFGNSGASVGNTDEDVEDDDVDEPASTGFVTPVGDIVVVVGDVEDNDVSNAGAEADTLAGCSDVDVEVDGG